MRAPQDEDSIAFQASSRFQTAHLVPAAHFPRPGFASFASPTPNRGWGGAPRNVRVRAKHPLGLHMTRQARRLRGALRPMTRDARLSALHRGGFRLPGPRFSHRHPPPLTLRRTLSKPAIALRRRAFAPDRLQRAPRSQVVVPGGRLPEPPGASGYGAATAGRHASLRVYFRQTIEFYGFSVGRAEPSALASTPTHGGCPQARSISAFAACRATPAMPARA